MSKESESQREGYYYNYVHDAAHLFWAARWLELHKSTEKNDQVIDQLLIRRLRKEAKSLIDSAIKGMSIKEKSVTEDGQALVQLIEKM